jgi:hypothetical protein
MADWINLLHGSVDAASHSPQRIPLQSVVAVCLWHEGDFYDDWPAAGLATSDDTKLQAIADSICQAYNVGLEDIHQVHVFSNSANVLCLTMDVSHHLGQHEVFTLPLVFQSDSNQTAWTPRTVLGLFLAERTAEYPV